MKSVQTKVIIYGAGRGGHLVAEMLSFDATKQVIGMVDDNSALWGKRVAGIEVLGGKARLLDLWHERYFDAVVISLATPSTMGLREEL